MSCYRYALTDGSFAGIANMTRHDLVAGLRELPTKREISIKLYIVRPDDLRALQSVWKCVITRKVTLDVTDVGSPDYLHEKLRIAAELMVKHAGKKTLFIDRVFFERRLAIFFRETVFDYVHINCGGEFDGAAMPRCREFGIKHRDGGFIQTRENDDFVPYVERLHVLSGSGPPPAYMHFPLKRCVVTFNNDAALENVSVFFPMLEELCIHFAAPPDTRTAVSLERFQSLRTLQISRSVHARGSLSAKFIHAMTTLRHLKRLSIINWGGVNAGFLMDMPQLERLRFTCVDYNQSSIAAFAYMLPRLRSLLAVAPNNSIAEDMAFRKDVGVERKRCVDRILLEYRTIARVFAQELAQLIFLMNKSKASHRRLLNIIRAPPECGMIDDQWK